MSSTAFDQSDVSSALRMGARVGYAARGVVYLLVGVLVLWTCVRGGGNAPGSTGALTELSRQPFGTFALWLVCGGLLAFALWRLVQAIRDTDRHGTDAKGLVLRFSLLVSALIHAALAWSAATIAQGLGANASEGWTAQLMQESWGRWLVGLIGAAVIAAGLAHVYKGWKAGFMKYFDVGRAQLGTLYTICRAGLIARGIVFGIIGVLLLQVATGNAPSEGADEGLRSAFHAILQQPQGVFLLSLVGLGLLAFSVYSFAEARHRRVRLR